MNAIRRAIVEWPATEACLARDSCSRSCAFRTKINTINAPPIYQSMMYPTLDPKPSDRKVLRMGDNPMTLRAMLAKITQQENLNFLLTNRLPRRWLTLFMGWVSRMEQPWLTRAGIAIWNLFTELDLSEAKASRFCRSIVRMGQPLMNLTGRES
jgi:hypothetical protein